MRVFQKAFRRITDTNRQWLITERENNARINDPNQERNLFEKIVFCVFGLLLVVIGIAFACIAISSKTELVDGFLLSVLFTVQGLYLISPKIIGPKVKAVFKVFWSPIQSLYAKYIPENAIDRLFENRLFQGIFLLSFAAILWNGSLHDQSDKQIFLVLGAVFFAICGFAALFPRGMKAIGIGILWLIGAGILIWVISSIAQAVGAIPFSIIVGALIIASAIKSNKS